MSVTLSKLYINDTRFVWLEVCSGNVNLGVVIYFSRSIYLPNYIYPAKGFFLNVDRHQHATH
jgi:hypothetical protein